MIESIIMESPYRPLIIPVYLLIENYTTFPLKSIPLIEVKPVALHRQQQHKNDDKHGYKTRDYPKVLS